MKKTYCFSPYLFNEFFTSGRSCERFAIYRGVLLYLAGDEKRHMAFIDAMPSAVVGKLLASAAGEGSVLFLWSCNPPKGYEEGRYVDIPGGDAWYVDHSERCTERI